METRKEKIKREIDNFVKVLEDRGDLNAARFFTQIAKPKCISEEKPLCYYLANTPYYLNKFGIAIESGADINFQNLIGDSALHALAFYGEKDQIEFLLNMGIGLNINLRNLAGATPLDIANARSKRSVIDLLKQNGAKEGTGFKDPDLDLSSENQQRLAEYDTLLQKAIKENYTEAITFLNIYKPVPIKVWPLHVIVQYPRQSIEIAKWMIDNGANLEARDHIGKTPLHTAAFFSAENIVKELCENAADVNTIDNNGCTPLHYAILQDKTILGRIKVTTQDKVKVNIIKILINYGADPKIRDHYCKTPMDLLDPKLKIEIEEYIAKISSEKSHSVDDSFLAVLNEVKDSTSIEQQDESQDPDMKILEEALRELEGEGV